MAGEILFGTWCSLGSSVTVEIAGNAGFDWVLIDLEHGSGDFSTLLCQLQAAENAKAVPIVRIVWNEVHRFKRALDMGASGVMVPFISTGEEARQAAQAMLFPPAGIRGVATKTRAAAYGRGFAQYYSEANDNILTVVQIENDTALQNIDDIAAVEGVDVLFIGPMDLSTNLGIQGQYDDPRFRDAVQRVSKAARKAGKVAGILLWDQSQAPQALEDGFTFISLGSDVGAVVSGMDATAAALNKLK